MVTYHEEKKIVEKIRENEIQNSLEDPVNSLESPTADELAKIEAIEIEFVQFVLPWLKLVPPDSCCQDKVCWSFHDC